MITSIRITGINYEVSELTEKYAIKRIGRLDRYVPRCVRKSMVADIKLQQVNHSHGNKYRAEITLTMDGGSIYAKDSTGNILAAIDVVEAKLMSQLSDYKFDVVDHLGRRSNARGLARRNIGE